MKGIFVFGYAASGKNYIVDKLKNKCDLVIDVGSVVRDICSREERVWSNDIDEELYKECKWMISSYDNDGEDCYNKRVIVLGLRSVELAEKMLDLFNDKDIFVIESSYNERKERFDNSDRAKDKGLTYQEVLENDRKIGLGDLMYNIYNRKYGSYFVWHN